MKPIFITWHLGLGDAIICAAIVAKYASERSQVSVPCYHHNLVSVKSFFVNLPNVTVVPVKDEQEMLAIRDQSSPHFEIMNLGFYLGEQPDGIAFNEWFYLQAGMEYGERLKWCPLSNAAEVTLQQIAFKENRLPYSFIHEDKKRGFLLRHYHGKFQKFIPNDITEVSILRYADAIFGALEIHVIDSAFLHLCESLPTTGKLFWHQYARPNPENLKLNKEWKIIK